MNINFKATNVGVVLGLLTLTNGVFATDSLLDLSRNLIDAAKKEDIARIREIESNLQKQGEKDFQSEELSKAQKELDKLSLKNAIYSSIDEEQVKGLFNKTLEYHKKSAELCGADGTLSGTVNSGALLDVEVLYQKDDCEGVNSWSQKMKINQEQLNKLVAAKPELKNALSRMSVTDKQALLDEVEKSLNESQNYFAKDLDEDQFNEISSGKVALAHGSVVEAVKKNVASIGADAKDPTLPYSVAKAKVRKLYVGEEEQKAALEQQKSLVSKAKDLLKTDGLAKIDNPCDLLKQGVLWEQLSKEDQEACKGQKDSFKHRLVASSSSKDSKDAADKLPADPDKVDAAGDERVERSRQTASGDKSDKSREDEAKTFNREAADQLTAARQMNEFLAAKNILNQLVMDCERSNLNAAMPMGANSTQIQKLDKLMDGFMSQTTACTTSSYVDSEMGVTAAADGMSLAEEALSDIYPKGAVGLSAEEANELPKERKCLARGMQASLRKLNAAEYYIKQHSWKLAQIEVMQLIGKNPEILARKQQEMIMMGDMRNPLMALKEEIQQDKISELSQVYDLDKIKRDHSVFKSLYAGVNQLYNARVEYIDASARAAASTSSSALPMAAPSAGKKLAPSRKQ